MECKHRWVANSGRGGEPLFKMNRQMAVGLIMYVKCSKCDARTWLDPKAWEDFLQEKDDG